MSGDFIYVVKENVQPIRSGRKPQLVQQVLSTPLAQHKSELDRKIEEFEDRLASCAQTGEDPFPVYLSYISFLEGHLVSGDQKQALLRLYERCTQSLQNESRLKQDRQFLRVWIKYADMALDPLDIFAYMDSKGIGTQLSAMYVLWSLACERAQNLKKADEVMLLGLRRLPESEAKLLRVQYGEFQRRCAANAAAAAANPTALANENRTRQVLAPRSVGSVQRAPLAPQHTRPTTSAATSQRTPSFDVYVDPQVPTTFPSLSRQISGSRSTLGGESDRRKENSGIATKWTEAPLPVSEAALLAAKRATTVVPREPVQSFQVYEDTRPALPIATPLGPAARNSTFHISANTVSSPDQRVNKVREDIQEDGTRRLQYSEYDRYHAWTSDGAEVSFEELRALMRHGYRDLALARGLGITLPPEQPRRGLASVPTTMEAHKPVSQPAPKEANPRSILRPSPALASENAPPQATLRPAPAAPTPAPMSLLDKRKSQPMEEEEDDKTRNFTLSGNLTINTRQALNSFLSIANPHDDDDALPLNTSNSAASKKSDFTISGNTGTFDFAAFLGQLNARNDEDDEEEEVVPVMAPNIAASAPLVVFEDNFLDEEDKENALSNGHIKDKNPGFGESKLARPSAVLRPLPLSDSTLGIEEEVETTIPPHPRSAECALDGLGIQDADFTVFEDVAPVPPKRPALPSSQSFLSDEADSFLNALNAATAASAPLPDHMTMIDSDTGATEPSPRNLSSALEAAATADATATINLTAPALGLATSNSTPTESAIPFMFEVLEGATSETTVDPYTIIAAAQSELVDALLAEDTRYAVVDYSDEKHASALTALTRVRDVYALGAERYTVVEALTQGCAVLASVKDGSRATLRVHSSAAQAAWAWYMATQLLARLPEPERPLVATPQLVHVYADCGVILEPYDSSSARSLKELRDMHVRKAQLFPEELCVFYVRELVRVLEALHSHDVVHGHISTATLRPRRALFDTYAAAASGPAEASYDAPYDAGLALRAMSAGPALIVDAWQNALDLRAFGNAQFATSATHLSALAARILGRMTWRHGVDFLALAEVAHYLLHGAPLTAAFDSKTQRWMPVLPLKAFWHKDLWTSLFDNCLNSHVHITSRADSLRALAALRTSMDDWLRANPRKLKALKLSFSKQFAVLDPK